MSDVIGRIEVFFDESKTDALAKNLGREIVARQVEALRDDIRLLSQALRVANEHRKVLAFFVREEFASSKYQEQLREVVRKTKEAMKDRFPNEEEMLEAIRSKYPERVI